MPYSNPLQIQFCQSTAQVWCEETPLRETIGRYFRHCLGTEPYQTVVTYHARNEEGVWRLQRDEEPPRHAPSEFHIYMTLALDVVANLVNRCDNFTVFHAAGLSYQGQGIVLCGQSDSGKSTLAAWLTANGFDFLTDEMVAITTREETMSGIPCPLILRQGSTFVWEQCVPDEEKKNLLHEFDGAKWIDPEQLRPHAVGHDVPPRLLIFPTYQADTPLTVQPVRQADAVFRLMQRIINFANITNRGIAEAKLLAQRCRIYEIRYSDMGEALAWIKETIESLD